MQTSTARSRRRWVLHEEVHAIGLQVVIESVVGRWDVLVDLTERAEAIVAANAEFPCQFNWRTLLVCALGLTYAGEEEHARRLVDAVAVAPVVAGPAEREPALLRLALLRRDEESARRILGLLPSTGDPFVVDAEASRLDALSALGESAAVEKEAEPFLSEDSYAHPFALRALGVTKGDVSLVTRAAEAFERIGLAWRAEETRAALRA